MNRILTRPKIFSAFLFFKSSYSESVDDSIIRHHHVVELMKPVMSFFKSEVHQRNTKLCFFMVTVHYLDD